jgi:hypothetical protein
MVDHTPSSASDQVERVATDGASKSKRAVLDYSHLISTRYELALLTAALL